MRVRFTENYTAHIEGQYRVDTFTAGQEFDGDFAQRLVDSGCPVEVLDEDPDGPGVDTDGDGVPEGSAKQVLEWVGDDKERAAMALDIEQAKGDNARSTLVASLTKLAG